jgi:hypothetical protein
VPAAAEEAEGQGEAKAAMSDFEFPVSGDQQNEEVSEGGAVEMPAGKQQGRKKQAATAAAKGKEGKAASGRGKVASGRGKAAAKSAAAGGKSAAAAAAGKEGGEDDQPQPDHIIGSNFDFDQAGDSGSDDESDESGSVEEFAVKGRGKGGSKAAGGRGKVGAAAAEGRRAARLLLLLLASSWLAARGRKVMRQQQQQLLMMMMRLM